MKAAEEMKREEREQLLKDTLLYFAPKDRYVTDEEGNVYYREDVTLKAMELSEPPLPPAEGAEIDDMMFTISEDGINPLNEQPTAEGGNLNLDGINYSDLPIPKPSLYPAEGAEQLIRVRNILQDFYRRGDYELEQAEEDIMRIFTQQPTAEGAEEILPAAYEWHNIKTGHCYVDYVPHLDAKDGYTKTPLYSTLHAQKIAEDKK